MDPVELRLYNTAARRVEAIRFDPAQAVRIYTCGPTVYRAVHLGNLRSYVLADSLKRLLLGLGYQVRHVKNITDVGHMRQELLDRGEDKVIAEALSAGLTPQDIARRYSEEFFRDEACINILPADAFPRATDHVDRMIQITAALVDRGFAYERSGNVYFRVSAFDGYGELGGVLSREGLRQGVRTEADPLKDDARDFALWKAAEPKRTELVWESPWGRGFPGWHIECTAMSTEHLGAQVDIHTGGVDNIFPHHEDERAQSEAFTGVRPFARVWLHGQHLLADGLKMAKSTGNAYTLSDLLALDFEPLAFRYLWLTAHYRARLNFTFTSLRAAQTGLHRLRRYIAGWGPLAEPAGSSQVRAGSSQMTSAAEARASRAPSDEQSRRADVQLSPEAEALRKQFWALAADDLALPRCLALVWSLVRGPHARLPNVEKAALVREFETLLGLDLGAPPLPRPADPLRGAVSSSHALGDGFNAPDRCRLSVVIAVQPDEDLAAVQRCVRSVVRTSADLDLEVVLVEATGTPAAHAELAAVCPDDPRVRVVWIDHDPGAAAARNLGLRASRGTFVALLDPSVELLDSPWLRLLAALDDRGVGAVGPYGLVTADMRHFHETLPAEDSGDVHDGGRPHGSGHVHDGGPAHDSGRVHDGSPPHDSGDGHDRGPAHGSGHVGDAHAEHAQRYSVSSPSEPDAEAELEVDALQAYLIVLRRSDLRRIGPLDEHYRFYRILDLDLSYAIRARVGRLLSVAGLPLVRHRHALWEALSEGDREERSRKNFGRFLKRWDHHLELARHGDGAALVGEVALHG